jgi:type IV pilus assembly protein PilP
MELSQLKVMGIIRAETGNRALVEEASGKGYIVKKGTYIGLNEGVVSKILKDRIIVRETVENYYGEVKIRNRELKIQKPPGEM